MGTVMERAALPASGTVYSVAFIWNLGASDELNNSIALLLRTRRPAASVPLISRNPFKYEVRSLFACVGADCQEELEKDISYTLVVYYILSRKIYYITRIISLGDVFSRTHFTSNLNAPPKNPRSKIPKESTSVNKFYLHI